MAGNDDDDNPPTYIEAVKVLTREIRHKYGINTSDVGRAFLMGNSDVVAIFPPLEDDDRNHGRSLNQSPSAATSPSSPTTGSVQGASPTPTRPATEINSNNRNIDSSQSGIRPQGKFQHLTRDPLGALDQKSREHSSCHVNLGNSRIGNFQTSQVPNVLPNQPIQVHAYPLPVSFEHDYLEIPHNCTQTDITWEAPANADLFEKLIYRLQVMVSHELRTVNGWEDVAECTSTQIRMYRVGEMVMINSKRYRPPKPFGIDVKLRIRAEGVPKELEVTRRGVWSEINLRLRKETKERMIVWL